MKFISHVKKTTYNFRTQHATILQVKKTTNNDFTSQGNMQISHKLKDSTQLSKKSQAEMQQSHKLKENFQPTQKSKSSMQLSNMSQKMSSNLIRHKETFKYLKNHKIILQTYQDYLHHK